MKISDQSDRGRVSFFFIYIFFICCLVALFVRACVSVECEVWVWGVGCGCGCAVGLCKYSLLFRVIYIYEVIL